MEFEVFPQPYKTASIQTVHTGLQPLNTKPQTPNPKPFIFVRMQVDDALVDKLATLAHLHFNREEKEAIKGDLQKMIGFIDKLQELDTTGVEPLMHMSDAVNVLREDVPGAMLSTEQALQNASQHDGHYFQVPKVIKK